MTPARINRLIRRWQDRLSLGDWQVRYCPDPANDDEHGSITFDYIHGTAYIQLEADIPDEAVEPVIAHEMLHLLLGNMQATTAQAVDQLGSEGKQLLSAQYDVDQHRVITKLLLLLGFDAAEWRVAGWNSAFPLTKGT